MEGSEKEVKLVTMKLTPVEVGIIHRSLAMFRNTAGDNTPVETTLLMVRFRNHDERLKQGY